MTQAVFRLNKLHWLQVTTGVWLNDCEKRAYHEWRQKAVSESPSVSVIVPALNEEAKIRHLVELLNKLQPPPAEVIVVDGGSGDRCACLRVSCRRHHVQYSR